MAKSQSFLFQDGRRCMCIHPVSRGGRALGKMEGGTTGQLEGGGGVG